MCNGVFVARLLAATVVLCLVGAVQAGELEQPKSGPGTPGFLKDHVEISTGGNGAGSAISAFGSVVVAPFARLSEDGWRLKVSGGYANATQKDGRVLRCGTFPSLTGPDADAFRQYCNQALAAGVPDAEIHQTHVRTITRYDAAIMPGYQISFGQVIVRAYAGVGYKGAEIPSFSALTQAAKVSAGAGRTGANGAGLEELFDLRGGLESWVALSDRLWLSVDASYSPGSAAADAARDLGGTVRLGYAALPRVTAGPELTAFRTVDGGTHDTICTGGFVRFQMYGTETTLSGGVAQGDGFENRAYGAINTLVRF